MYLLHRSISTDHYKINNALLDILPTPEARIGNAIQQIIKGVSESNALALITFFAAQVNSTVLLKH